MKNQHEEELLKLEDELHEFDVMIQQFEFFRLYLHRIVKNNLPAPKKLEYIQKLLNSKVIFAIYGSKASVLLGPIAKCDYKVLEMLSERLGDQITKLQKAKSEYREFWRSSMEDIYYRALDVLSNTLKLEEKKLFVNKEMIDELKEFKKVNNHYKLYDSIKVITKEPNNQLVALESKYRRFFKPSFVFKTNNKNVLEDAVLLLRLWLCCSKLSLTEKEKANSIIAKIIVRFLGITEKPGKILADLMNEETDLIAEILDVTTRIEPKSDYKYFGDYDPVINEQKLPELYTILTSLEPYEISTPEPEEPKIIPNSMAIKPESHKAAEKVFFASPMFYLFYRYVFLIIERLNFVYNYSQSVLKTDEVYLIFVKLLALNLQGSLTNQHYEDSLKLILRNNSGLFLNFDKYCQTAIKLNLNDEFSNFVLDSNPRCFGIPNAKPVREDILFAKTCYKLNELAGKTSKTKSNQANSNFYGIPNNEILKFEFSKGHLVVHRFKNIYQEESRFADSYQALIDTYKSYLYKSEGMIDKNMVNGFSENDVVLHINHKRKEPVFMQCNEEDVVIGVYEPGNYAKEVVENKVQVFRESRVKLFERGLNR